MYLYLDHIPAKPYIGKWIVKAVADCCVAMVIAVCCSADLRNMSIKSIQQLLYK